MIITIRIYLTTSLYSTLFSVLSSLFYMYSIFVWNNQNKSMYRYEISMFSYAFLSVYFWEQLLSFLSTGTATTHNSILSTYSLICISLADFFLDDILCEKEEACWLTGLLARAEFRTKENSTTEKEKEEQDYLRNFKVIYTYPQI